MLWLCLRFPRLALDALQTTASAVDARPCAVIDGPMPSRHIVLADAASQAAGVRAGQPLASAQALCPRLRTLARDRAAEQQSLQAFATLAWRYSAELCVHAPDSILLEVGASLKLFGGWPALQRRLRSELAHGGFSCQLAAAPTASAAHVLACAHGDIAVTTMPALHSALTALPIAHSGLDDKTIDALHGMGLRRLGELFRLPRTQLGRRLGAAMLARLDRLRGLLADEGARWQPPAGFQRRIEFDSEVTSTTALAFVLQRLIRELALFLLARDGGVQRFGLVIGHARDARTRIDVGLLAPQRDAASLFELARARLERCALPAPALSLALHADELPPLVPAHQDLFEAHARSTLDWPALAERLRARLGDDALHGLACHADHRPARAWQRIAPALGARADSSRTSRSDPPADATSFTSAPRPFWLLQRPLALRQAPQRILAGPERIESGWWDGHDQRRDYYIVELRSGQRAWAFVEAGTQSPWTLHGWFA